MSGMFSGWSKLTDLTPLTNWQTGNVTDMSSMFYSCSQLTDLTPLANWQTSKVTDMKSMFNGCNELTNTAGINNWDIARVKKSNFIYMFRSCPSHPEFTKRIGTWDSNGTFTPTA